MDRSQQDVFPICDRAVSVWDDDGWGVVTRILIDWHLIAWIGIGLRMISRLSNVLSRTFQHQRDSRFRCSFRRIYIFLPDHSHPGFVDLCRPYTHRILQPQLPEHLGIIVR